MDANSKTVVVALLLDLVVELARWIKNRFKGSNEKA